MSAETDTPRTDAAARDGYTFHPEDLRPAVDFARQLERELNEARQQRDRLAEALRKTIPWVEAASERLAYSPAKGDALLLEIRAALTEVEGKEGV